MRKMIFALVAALMALCLAACGAQKSESTASKAGEFQPSLDKNTACQINVAGSYSNFEALEAEFDRFNEY